MRRCLGILAAMAALAGAGPVQARKLLAQDYTVMIEVLPSGDLRVLEDVTYRFSGGPFTWVQRTIPHRRTDGVEVVFVDTSATVYVRERSTRIEWRFPACSDTTRRFQVLYRVQGAVVREGDHAVLRWTGLPEERSFRIVAASVSIESDSIESVRFRPRRATVRHGGRSWHARIRNLSNESNVSLRATFAPGAFAGVAPRWAAARAQETERAAYALAVAAALLLLGLALVVAMWRDTTSHLGGAVAATRATSPPSDLAPPLAGALADGDANLRHAFAGLADLAARGVLRFEVRPRSRWMGRAIVVRRAAGAAATAPWEVALLGGVFRQADADGSVRLQAVWRGLRRAFPEFRAAVRAALQARGEFAADVAERRRPLAATSGSALALAAASAAAAPFVWSSAGPALVAVPMAFGAVALAAGIAAAAVRRHTTLGRQRAAAWRGFAQHLHALPQLDAPLEASRFVGWFPYAIALGAVRHWVRAGMKHGLRPPAWFDGPKDAGADLGALMSVFAASGCASPTGGKHVL